MTNLFGKIIGKCIFILEFTSGTWRTSWKFSLLYPSLLLILLTVSQWNTMMYWKSFKNSNFQLQINGKYIHPVFNPYHVAIFLYKTWRTKSFFQFEIIINVFPPSFSFSASLEYLCYEFTTSRTTLILSVEGQSSYVRIWCIQTSNSDVWSRSPRWKGYMLVV